MTDEAKALVAKLRDVDSYYRIQEKHWCIDAEELERQRLAAADLIETQAREIERLRERLEIDPAHPYDGITARDETIRGLDAQLAKFKALAETLAGALEEAAYSVGMSSYDRHKVADKVLLQYKEARDES